MYSKAITWILFGIVLCIFTIYFITQSFLFNRGQLVPEFFEKISADAQAGKWDDAEERMKEYEELWKKSKYFVAFNNGEQNFSNYQNTITHLKAAIKAKDTSTTIEMAALGTQTWKNLMKIVPMP